MDWLPLILSIFLASYSLYAWKRNSDREWMWLGSLGVLSVLLLTVRMFFIAALPENVRPIFDFLRYLGWLFLLGALVFIEIRKRRR
jgi:hypothetical protein